MGAFTLLFFTAAPEARKGYQPPLIDDHELPMVPNPANSLNNSLGFRGAEFSAAKLSGITRIVFIGDSTLYSTRGDGVVEMLVKRHTGDSCEIINGAVQQLTGPDLWTRYERDVKPLDPEVVVLMGGVAHARLYRPSIAAPLYEVSMSMFSAERAMLDVYAVTPPINVEYTDGDWLIAWDAVEPAEFAGLVSVLNDVTRASGLPVLDAAGEVEWHSDDFYDVTHLNAQGYERLANWLDEYLVDDLCHRGF